MAEEGQRTPNNQICIYIISGIEKVSNLLLVFYAPFVDKSFCRPAYKHGSQKKFVIKKLGAALTSLIGILFYYRWLNG